VNRLFDDLNQKVVTILNGFDNNQESRNPEESKKIKNKYSEGKDYFIYVGAIHPRKNLIRLVQAFEDFSDKYKMEYNLIIAGRMAWKSKEFLEFVNNSKYKERIKLIGFVDNYAKSILISSALALIYVSLYEGFGFPVLEGMSAGTPVICSRESSLPEVAGEAAILVDPQNILEISKAMKQVLSPEISNELIEKGRHQVNKFSWDVCSQETYSLLLDCVK
jgi:glycosyltransferase involved in cell wall biosynthesis